MLSAALVLTACGDDDDADTASDRARDTTAGTHRHDDRPTGETRTVEADNGTIEVPADPQRVATIGNTTLPFIDLGGKPVGVTEASDSAVDLLPEDQQATYEAATDRRPAPTRSTWSSSPAWSRTSSWSRSPDADVRADRARSCRRSPRPSYFGTRHRVEGLRRPRSRTASNMTEALSEQKAEFEDARAGIQEKYREIIDDTSFVDVSRGDWNDPGTFDIADIGCSEIARDDVGMDFPEAAEGEDPLAYASLPFEQLSEPVRVRRDHLPRRRRGPADRALRPVVETNTWKALPAVTSGRALGSLLPRQQLLRARHPVPGLARQRTGDPPSRAGDSPRPAADDGPGTATVPGPRRRLLGLVVALVVLVVLLVLSVMIGSTAIAPSVVWDALFHPSADIDQFAIRDFRLPRTIVGLVVGVALGLSGALIQALTRNPLADPGILGVNAGASFAVTVAVGLLGVRDIQGYMWFAFAGALVVTLMVLALGSTRQGSRRRSVMVLAGVCVGAVLGGRSGRRSS